ncbi:CRISPR-associated endonuclease Cas2 [Candidatus Kaiserbacteria bacterium RIFCSPHIGHO2_01_FULL_53_29]|uniref:CRISPR-associated endonuclease Cas2 n=1 Tax=Candidatus Kaiserbacteria bacterium RIFCSPHIGHO2_01_FULL_53_29 TaxID=1798480 RepID=A0A1F6CXA8_9BACT|nr:MAG: CRISPR-associated endonuclease Cas2 [Candidatus Kaiserbacteria bacterium RIFCSPHIGHO2_01_FULL_53_29]
MGKIEEGAKRVRRLGLVQRALLGTIGMAGVIALIAIAPNAIAAFGLLGRNKYRFKNQSDNVLTRLKQQGYISFEERNGERFARITDAGRHTLLRNGVALSKKIRFRWDKRWRVIIFDIPEKRRRVRDTLRETMKSFGFYRLQDSVWVYPYDCEEIIMLLKADLRLGGSVLYMVVEKIENDKHLKETFGLS